MTKAIESFLGAIASLFERNVPTLVVLSVGSVAGLISGGAFLETPLVRGLPVGNVLAAAALCLPACVAIGLSRPRTVVRYFSVVSLIAGCAWLPISVGLAGNLTLNFSDLRGRVWVWASLATIVVVLLALVWAMIDRRIRGRSHGGSARAFDCGFNESLQQLNSTTVEEDVADGISDEDLLHRS